MNRLKLYTTLKGTFPWLISIVCISICVTLYYQISKEADDSTEVTKGSNSYTLYEEYFGLKQGELARSMNIKSADELGKEGFLNSHFGGITIGVGEGICVQYSNTDSISEDILPCGIIIESDNTKLGFMGARAGMNFWEIQDNSYPEEVKKGFIYNEEIDVYYLEYLDESYRYLYLSYDQREVIHGCLLKSINHKLTII